MENRFEFKYKQIADMGLGKVMIIVDKETGVNYLFVAQGNAGGLSPLLDFDGQPVISFDEGE
ncbi:MAG: DUF6440 family protein [Erysipelotrichaceae bacterium]